MRLRNAQHISWDIGVPAHVKGSAPEQPGRKEEDLKHQSCHI